MHEANGRGGVANRATQPKEVSANLKAIALEESTMRPSWLHLDWSNATASVYFNGDQVIRNTSHAEFRITDDDR